MARYNDDGVNLDDLEQHEYDDTPGEIFYTCPKCGGEYLETFMENIGGNVMCIDCAREWEQEHGMYR